MKLSRRELAGLTVAAAMTPNVSAQTPAASTAAAEPAPVADPVSSARDAVRRNAEALAKFEIPIATEPAFVFRP